jgi:glucose/arabinose dehydrogenase
MISTLRWSALTVAVAIAACSGKAELDPAQQSGAAPEMPAARNFLLPPMQVPDKAGWKDGQTPKVAEGLRIEKIAGDLMHPRQLYTLPNGDVLVVESNGPGTEAVTTPKQLIAGKIKNLSGKGAKGGDRITLLRRNATGSWDKHMFLEHLHSPFGVQLIGDAIYVANTDAIRKYPYQSGATGISDPGVEFADLPGTVNHHWTKALLASPDGTKLYVGVGSNSNVGENGLEVEYRRAVVLEVDVASRGSRIYASGIRNPTGLGWEPVTGKLWAIANERDEIGADLVPDYLTSVQEGAFSTAGRTATTARMSISASIRNVRTWWRRRSSRTTRWGRTLPHSAFCSRSRTHCPRSIKAARSSPSMGVGIVHRSAVMPSCTSHSRTESQSVHRRRS